MIGFDGIVMLVGIALIVAAVLGAAARRVPPRRRATPPTVTRIPKAVLMAATKDVTPLDDPIDLPTTPDHDR